MDLVPTHVQAFLLSHSLVISLLLAIPLSVFVFPVLLIIAFAILFILPAAICLQAAMLPLTILVAYPLSTDASSKVDDVPERERRPLLARSVCLAS